jgi:eukaryotic-like serine/threonine-protein kinase
MATLGKGEDEKVLPPSSRTSRTPPVTTTGMREELRAALLKIFVLKLRAARGDEAARDVLVGAGIDPYAVDLETAWVSVEATRRAMLAVSEELGPTWADDVSTFVAHPEALGIWVRLVREAHEPLDAYRYVVTHTQELFRVGEYTIDEPAPNPKTTARTVTITYRPRPDEPAETDDFLCRMRQAQLSGLPLLWGVGAAHITQETCLAKGGDCCKYKIDWDERAKSRIGSIPLALISAVAAGALVAPFHYIGGAISAVVAGGLGYGLGEMLSRQGRADRERAFEKTRIAALERGLELRGEAPITSQGDLVGTILGGKYRIGKRIGSGGIGVVHAAEHLGLGTQVAVKVLRGAAAKDGSEIARLRREAQVASALDHPNVVKVFDLDQLPDGSIFVVMELLRGRSLAEKLHRDGPLAPGYAVQVFRQVCLALQAAHDIGVVHRDLKPGNVFLLEDGESAKVLDFGMSKLATGTLDGKEKLTQDGYTLGTPEYMAPEQCIGATVEARTDIYELGVLIYEAVTGDLPIKSTNRRELLDLHQRQVPPPMRQRRPDLPIPKELDDVIALCLRKRVHERPESAKILERMLAAVPLDDVPMHYPRNVGRSPQRRPVSEDPRPTEKARSR